MDNKLFHKNFSLLIAGQASSLFGNCILDFALSMYVLEITGSATIFASFLAVAMLPTILLSPLGGVIADRANKRNIMVILDFATGITILISAMMIDRANNLVIICITLIIQSILGAFETPTVQACVPQMQKGDNIVRGNAIVNQINAISTFVAPFIGSLLYTTFGLKPVMFAGVFCFLLTAFLECFIKLDYKPEKSSCGIFQIVKGDLIDSTRFICRERPAIFKTLILTAIISFFVQGVALVGLPYIVRTVLGLNANYYGAMESMLGFTGILGSIIAGLIVEKFKIRKLYLTLLIIAIPLLPCGIIFLFVQNIQINYAILLLSFAIIQISACVFSVFALSIIQQLTPDNMTGKVMAYTATFSLCAQPLGQIIFGILFDGFSSAVYLVLIPTGIILSIISLTTKEFFLKIEKQIN
jgi:MFS family permease